MIGLSVTGNKTAFLDLQIAGRRLDETLRNTVRDLAREYNARLKADLARPKGGKQYGASNSRIFRRTKRKATVFGKSVTIRTVAPVQRRTRAYTASGPGEAPAQRTGNLLRAVKIKFPARQKGYGAKVFADRGIAFYRHFLEFGTKPRIQRRWRGKPVSRAVGRVAPRPVFSPLQAQLDAELERRLARAADLFAAFSG
jgi:hypothetical protein